MEQTKEACKRLEIDFNEKLNQQIMLAKSYRGKLAVLLIDLDTSKQTNEKLDELVRLFSIQVKSDLRKSDAFSHLGGSKFAIILTEIEEAEEALAFAERILASVQAPFQMGEIFIRITLCIGISLYPKDGMNSKQLMKHADAALFDAKELGKNKIKMYMMKIPLFT